MEPIALERFMLLNGIGYPACALGQADAELPGNYLIGISRLAALGRSEIAAPNQERDQGQSYQPADTPAGGHGRTSLPQSTRRQSRM